MKRWRSSEFIIEVHYNDEGYYICRYRPNAEVPRVFWYNLTGGVAEKYASTSSAYQAIRSWVSKKSKQCGIKFIEEEVKQ